MIVRPSISRDWQPRRSRFLSAFTMVEIALCLAIIGFALVAIIGVLPMGMQVQQDNREDTLIAQDGTYLLEAIRNGATGIDQLPSFVEKIYHLRSNGPVSFTAYETNFNSGAQVVGRLFDPSLVRAEAIMRRSLSGAAAQTGGTTAPEIAFGYKVISEVIGSPVLTNDLPGRMPEALSNNLYEVRLTLRYPLLPGNKTGSGKQVFRTLVSGIIETNADGTFLRSTSFLPLQK